MLMKEYRVCLPLTVEEVSPSKNVHSVQQLLFVLVVIPAVQDRPTVHDSQTQC